jgi:hypothetical protein
MKSNVVRSAFLFLAAAAFLAVSASPAFAAPDSPSCPAAPETGQFGFWLGDWSISSPGAAPNASSSVTLDLDHCLVVESWQGERDHLGKNMFAYNPEEKSWLGMFVDNKGHVHVFNNGKVSGGAAEFLGPSHGPNGETVLNRIRIVRLANGNVEQSWDKSRDNGATWTSQFRLTYTRKRD